QRDSASVRALREAGAVITGKTVTTEFAASEPGPTRNPWDIERTPGGSSSGSAAGVAAGFFSAALGTQVIGSILRPASYCGVTGYKPTFGAINRGGSHDYMSQSAQGVLAASLADAWQVMREIGDRTGGDPGHGGLQGPSGAPPVQRPATLAFLETAGWADASDAAKHAMFEARRQIERAGIKVIDRNTSAQAAEAERAIASALPVSYRLNTWESRWPLNTYRDRDESKLSAAMLKRARDGEAMSLQEYREALAEREHARRIYARLADVAGACISLSAAGCAPVGLRSTGNAAFVVTGSMLGAPSISIPVLAEQELPLGMQVLGFHDGDADIFAIAAALMEILPAAQARRA
ncbi:MAG: amidase, partial [Alphaproteobacteria bacterium]|nr:amidase [Alphaproteobacteria bacterium]